MRSLGTTFVVTPFDVKHLTPYLKTKVMSAPSLTVYEIFANKDKFQNVDLEN